MDIIVRAYHPPFGEVSRFLCSLNPGDSVYAHGPHSTLKYDSVKDKKHVVMVKYLVIDEFILDCGWYGGCSDVSDDENDEGSRGYEE